MIQLIVHIIIIDQSGGIQYNGSSNTPSNLESTNPDFQENLLRSAQNRFSFKYQNRQNVNIHTYFLSRQFSDV